MGIAGSCEGLRVNDKKGNKAIRKKIYKFKKLKLLVYKKRKQNDNN